MSHYIVSVEMTRHRFNRHAGNMTGKLEAAIAVFANVTAKLFGQPRKKLGSLQSNAAAHDTGAISTDKPIGRYDQNTANPAKVSTYRHIENASRNLPLRVNFTDGTNEIIFAGAWTRLIQFFEIYPAD